MNNCRKFKSLLKSSIKSLFIAIFITLVIYGFGGSKALTIFINQYYVAIAIALFSTLIASLAILVPWLFTYYKLLIKALMNKQKPLTDLFKSSSYDLVEFLVWLATSFIVYVVCFLDKTEVTLTALFAMMFFIVSMIMIVKGCVDVMIILVKFLLSDIERISFKN